jgi:hypothetical protein
MANTPSSMADKISARPNLENRIPFTKRARCNDTANEIMPEPPAWSITCLAIGCGC